MSSVLTAPVRVEIGPARLTWMRVEDGFYVASRAGEYVGFAERTTDGHFLGFDSRSTPIGRYADLKEAQRAVATAPVEQVRPESPALGAALHATAAATGLIAIATLATALLTLPGV